MFIPAFTYTAIIEVLRPAPEGWSVRIRLSELRPHGQAPGARGLEFSGGTASQYQTLHVSSGHSHSIVNKP
jgi:hypothetical protein